MFHVEEHWRLADTPLSIQGKYLLICNDHSQAWELCNGPGIYIKKVSHLPNIA